MLLLKKRLLSFLWPDLVAYSTSFLKAKTSHEPCELMRIPQQTCSSSRSACGWQGHPSRGVKNLALPKARSKFCPWFWHVIQVIPDGASVFRTGAGHTQLHVIGQKDHHAIQHRGEMTMQAITGYQSLRHAAIKTPRELPCGKYKQPPSILKVHFIPFHFSERTTLVPIFTRSKKSEKKTVNCMKKGKRQRQYRVGFGVCLQRQYAPWAESDTTQFFPGNHTQRLSIQPPQPWPGSVGICILSGLFCASVSKVGPQGIVPSLNAISV